MSEPSDVAGELIRRAYTKAPLPDFDVSAGLADLHTRIKESGVFSTPKVDLDSVTVKVTSSAPGHPEPTGSRHCDEPQADTPQTAVGVRVGARITGSTRDKFAADIMKKYERGASIRALAESTGRSYGFIQRVLVEAGVHLRGRGGTTRTKKK
jgi:hypothetical protein